MTDAAWYDKGLLLECKEEFRICSYARLAVDSVVYKSAEPMLTLLSREASSCE